MRQLTLDDLEYTIGVINELLNMDEPVLLPPRKRLGRLQACLEQPFASFDGHALYPTLEERAAMLFYLLIKNHPLPNGNKRVAVVTTGFFLIENNYFPMLDPIELYHLATATSETEAQEKESVVSALTDVFRDKTRPMTNKEVEQFNRDAA